MEFVDVTLADLAHIALTVFLILICLRWILVVWIWCVYDRHILNLKTKLDTFRKDQRGNRPGVASVFIEGAIDQETSKTNDALEILETKRRLLIDRINLLVSLSSINNKT